MPVPFTLLIAIAIAALTLLIASGRPAQAGSPEAYVQALADQATAVMSNTALDAKSRENAFRALILDNTDLDKVAKFALGRYVKDMQGTNRYEEYRSLFREYVVRIYASRLGQGSSQKLTIIRSVPRGTNEVIVYSRIEPAVKGDAPIDLNWRLSRNSETYKILDVQIAGAWMSTVQQEQFTAIISPKKAKEKPQPVKVIDYLRQQLNQGTPNGAT